MAEWTLEYSPTPKQAILHSVNTTQILYGGAAGGGKSHSLRMDGILACLQNPGLQAYLFRRTYPELVDNHISKIKSMAIPQHVAVWNETRKQLEFTNKSIIQFCFAENEDDVTRYQGAEMHWLGIDEAALFLPGQLKYLRTRSRLGNFKPKQDGYFPRIVYSSNPGGPGHDHLRRVFLTQAKPMHVFRDKTTRSKGSEGWRSIYIPARMDDNPYLDVESYEGAFTDLSKERARALRDGDWDVVSGAAFDMLERDRHQIRDFEVPRHWTHIMSMDWGTAKPFAVGWWAVSEGAMIKGRNGDPDLWLPPGALIHYDELYGWNGESNVGQRKASGVLALEILEYEKARNMPPIDIRLADPQMWAEQDGPSPAMKMKSATDGRLLLRQGRRDRKANYEAMIDRLAGDEFISDDGLKSRIPMLYVMPRCWHWWRTLPGLLTDNKDPDKGPETNSQEDHCWDQTAFVVAHYAPIRTKEDRFEEEAMEFFRQNKRSVDPYAVSLR